MTYRFRYFIGSSPEPVEENRELGDDQSAITRAASSLLQLPGRTGVEVWVSGRLLYSRRR